MKLNIFPKDVHLGLQGYIAILALISILVYLILHFVLFDFQRFANFPLYVTLLIGGGLLIYELLRKVAAFDFGADILAGISIVTAAILGEYLAGALVVLMLSGGQALENYAIRTASQVLEALARRAPTIAHRKKNDLIEDISVKEIATGDAIVIFPHETCPVDGTVIAGSGVMDESYLTGEPFLISKVTGSGVMSGAINGEASLTIRASRLAEDSRYAKIMQVMKESQQKRPHMRRLADTLGAWYTPLAVIIALFAWTFTQDPVRFLAVLVIATPCPLLLAIPVAIIGSISLAAKRGILIKDPLVLERIGTCKTMIFDKTGTLTYGKPDLSESIAYHGFEPQMILRLVASLERYSKHPLAGAILAKAKTDAINLIDVEEIREVKGEGLRGKVGGHEVWVTSRKQLKLSGLGDDSAILPEGGGLECLIIIDGKLACYYRFRDAPRKESRLFIKHLSPKHGFNKLMIVSGDRTEEVRYLANLVGVAEIYGSKSPEEKVALVQEEMRKAKTVFLGDGINDAPALAAASVGIALGINSDITGEAAGAVIMDNSLEKVDELLHISQRMRKIALQSAFWGMGLSLIGMLIAAFGYLPPVAGAISQEIIDVIVILNALRTISRPKLLTDMPKLP